MGRHIASNALTFLILGLVLIVGVIDWSRNQYFGPGPLEEERIVEIPSGSSFDRITEELKDAGVISSESIFRIGWRYSGLGGKEKAAIYAFEPGVSMQEVARMLSEGDGAAYRFQVTYLLRPDDVRLRFRDVLSREAIATDDEAAIRVRIAAAEQEGASVDYRVTVSEGLTSYEIVQGLNSVDVLTGDLEDIPPEGSLAPDTYSVRKGSDRAGLLSRMAQAQERIIAAAWEKRQPDLPITTPEEMLILASIVEKEAGGPDEWQIVSSVFINRLRLGMRLQADATIVYGITEGRSRRGFDIRQSEIDARTAYNTYQIDGLPPTPIGNPGRRAIEATVTPAETSFLFFVADGSGGHAFAETLAEHERNVAAWKQIEAQRSANQ